MPLVSIVIPVYNGANYLNQAIDSALSQTYKNIEVIVVNDGSDDNDRTEEIAELYGDKIKYFYKSNGGVATALNAGIQLASGEFISWLSHDDLYHHNKIERQMSLLSTMKSNNVVLYADYEAIDANSKFIRTVKLNAPEELDSKQAFLFLLFQSSVHGCSLLLPKKCFTEVGYFDENLRTTQDYDLWFKLLRNGYEFRHMPEVLISARWHDEQGTRSLYKVAHGEIEALFVDAADTCYDDIDRMPVTTIMELIVDLRERKLGKAANHLLKLIRSRNKLLYNELYGLYSDRLIKSQLRLMTAKMLELSSAIIRRLGLRGRG